MGQITVQADVMLTWSQKITLWYTQGIISSKFMQLSHLHLIFKYINL